GEGALVESFSVFLTPSRIWNYQRFGETRAIEGSDGGNVNFTLRGGWDIEIEADRNFFRPDPDDYLGIEVATSTGPRAYQPLAHIGGHGFGFDVSTPTFRLFDASVGVSTGKGAIFEEAADGRGFEAEIDVSARPTAQIRLTATAEYVQITRERDDSEFARSLIPRVKAEYQAARHLFFRGIVEYRNERRAGLVDARTGEPLLFAGELLAAERDKRIRLDALISYEPTPGTVAYVGYGSSYAELPALTRGFRRREDGFFVKLAYQFRR
ncbi:MAG TPA: hypothetical protein VGD27_05365, partial [Longimicrobiales bacterium]